MQLTHTEAMVLAKVLLDRAAEGDRAEIAERAIAAWLDMCPPELRMKRLAGLVQRVTFAAEHGLG